MVEKLHNITGKDGVLSVYSDRVVLRKAKIETVRIDKIDFVELDECTIEIIYGDRVAQLTVVEEKKALAKRVVATITRLVEEAAEKQSVPEQRSPQPQSMSAQPLNVFPQSLATGMPYVQDTPARPRRKGANPVVVILIVLSFLGFLGYLFDFESAEPTADLRGGGRSQNAAPPDSADEAEASAEAGLSRDNGTAAPTSLYAGTFFVDSDIPPGRYVFTAEGSGNFVVYNEAGRLVLSEILSDRSDGWGVPSVTVDVAAGDYIEIYSIETVTCTPAETTSSLTGHAHRLLRRDRNGRRGKRQLCGIQCGRPPEDERNLGRKLLRHGCEQGAHSAGGGGYDQSLGNDRGFPATNLMINNDPRQDRVNHA